MQPYEPPCVNLVRAFKHLYDKVISAGQMNGSTEEWFKRTVRIGKGVFSHPPSSTFFSKGLYVMRWQNMMEGLA